MAKVRALRKEASALLRAAKKAFKFIRDNPSGHENERKEVLKLLLEVIDRVDPPVMDERITTVELTMTNGSADCLLDALKDRSTVSEEDEAVLEAVMEGIRRTKQRVYVRLDLNPSILRRLRYVLKHTKTKHSDSAFERLASYIETEGLDKNPMEILGRMGL